MKKIFRFLALTVITLTGCSTLRTETNQTIINETKTAQFYQMLLHNSSPNIAQLNLFFYNMPKGGDLHNHFSGSIYAETYLDFAEKKGVFINKEKFTVEKEKNEHTLSVNELRKNPELYSKLLAVWSTKDFSNHTHLQSPPDITFFSTFPYFSPLSKSSHEGVKILKERAIKENVSYIELMLKSPRYAMEDANFDKQSQIAKNQHLTALFDQFIDHINHDPMFEEQVSNFIKKTAKIHKGIDDKNFMMRFQTYAYRNSSPSVVFSNLYAAFTAAKRSPLIVGVNIVGAENNPIALKNYTLHMEMFAYLSKKFPHVKKSLHAGELTLGMVRPKNLTFHISQAINIAGANRIGHGVDLPYEENGIALLEKIKKQSVIEICFTSNEFILGVKGRAHPYLIYSAYGVPIVICSDDSGISRNNLTHQYVLLAIRYSPNYRTIKKYVYNSIKYAFLTQTEKLLLTKHLDEKFAKFEEKIALYSASISKKYITK